MKAGDIGSGWNQPPWLIELVVASLEQLDLAATG